MTDEAWKSAAIIVPSVTTVLAGLFYRMWSHYEHKGNQKDVSEIKIFINGEMEKKLQEVKDKAFEEGRNFERTNGL